MAELKSIGRAKKAAKLKEEKESELKCDTNDDYYSTSRRYRPTVQRSAKKDISMHSYATANANLKGRLTPKKRSGSDSSHNWTKTTPVQKKRKEIIFEPKAVQLDFQSDQTSRTIMLNVD